MKLKLPHSLRGIQKQMAVRQTYDYRTSTQLSNTCCSMEAFILRTAVLPQFVVLIKLNSIRTAFAVYVTVRSETASVEICEFGNCVNVRYVHTVHCRPLPEHALRVWWLLSDSFADLDFAAPISMVSKVLWTYGYIKILCWLFLFLTPVSHQKVPRRGRENARNPRVKRPI